MNNQDFHGIAVQQISNTYQKNFYKTQIDLFVENKIVIDLGAGSGILSFLSVMAGAKKVYAVEKNHIICTMLKRAINQLGWQQKIIVLNKDFINDDLSLYFEEANICVSEIINHSYTNNIFAKIITSIKEKHKHLKIIPGQFSYQARIIKSKHLDKKINWNYNPKLNDIFDGIYLNFTIHQPLKLLNVNFKKEIQTDPIQLIAYDFNTNDILNDKLILPSDKKNKWLEISWHFDNKIFDYYWQYEYIPLSIDWFIDANSITMIPKKFTHVLQKS